MQGTASPPDCPGHAVRMAEPAFEKPSDPINVCFLLSSLHPAGFENHQALPSKKNQNVITGQEVPKQRQQAGSGGPGSCFCPGQAVWPWGCPFASLGLSQSF